MRLIDADNLTAIVNSATILSDRFKDAFCKLVDGEPTVDAVTVIHCRDCKHKGWVQEPCHGKSIDYCRVYDCTLRDLETNFCSYGERKNADENGSR